MDEQLVALLKTYENIGLYAIKDNDQQTCSSLIKIASNYYYNKQPIINDNAFDILRDYVESKWPYSSVLKNVGAMPNKNRIILPHYMGSMNKLKDDNSIYKWLSIYNEPYSISAKLDGVSGMIDYTNNKMYTRGDGQVGHDISHLIPFINIGNPLNTMGLCVRGEFIMKKEVFERKYKPQGASNPRNFVSGIINSKTIDKQKCLDIDFLCYEIISPEGLTQSEQFEQLKKHNFKTAYNTNILTKQQINTTLLTNILLTWREMIEYEIDGIIITCDSNSFKHTSIGNPQHSFAFKTTIGNQEEEVVVTDVIWTPSQDGYLKPRIRFKPVNIGGVMIEYTTGFNGAFIRDKGIGVGSIVRLIRSGDVIPYITDIIHSTEPLMPDSSIYGNYEWTPSNVDIVLVNPNNSETVREKNITGFFTCIGVDGLSSGNVRRLINAGYDTIKKILEMQQNDFLKVDGFKIKMATKLYENIHYQLKNASIQKILVASNLIGRGFGEKKINKIFEEYPNVLVERNISRLSQINGFSLKTATEFIQNIPQFILFLEDIGWDTQSLVPINNISLNSDDSLNGNKFVFSGFRDKSLEEIIKLKGAEISSSVSKNTTALIIKSKDESIKSSKYINAETFGIPIYTILEFREKYKV